jgi:hypothetical protein
MLDSKPTDANKPPHEWSASALLDKAKRYATKMRELPRDGWEFGFWSALCLEMIVRAAVAKTSPALLADTREQKNGWKNLAYALEKLPAPELPKSIDVSEAAKRVQELHDGFTDDLFKFTTEYMQARNSEFHSGTFAFDFPLPTRLEDFYASCEALLVAAGSSLTEVFGSAEAATAATLIASRKEDAAKAVWEIITAHKARIKARHDDAVRNGNLTFTTRSTRWSDLSMTDVQEQAGGRLQTCPACSFLGFIQGTPAGPPIRRLHDGWVETLTPFHPARFICRGCELTITGYLRLKACGMGEKYTVTVSRGRSDT